MCTMTVVDGRIDEREKEVKKSEIDVTVGQIKLSSLRLYFLGRADDII